MKKLDNSLKIYGLAAIVSLFFLSACNKDLDQFDPLPTPVYPAGNVPGSLSIARTLEITKADTMFYRLLVRSGLLNQYNDSTKTFTLFSVDSTGMKLFVNQASSGAVPLNAPDANFYAFINNSLPVASAAGIIQYHTLGQKYLWNSIPTVSPNFPISTLIQLDPINNPFIRMTTCIGKTAAGTSYVNNVPVVGAIDQLASNGVIHHTFSIVQPPTAVLKSVIASEPSLSYFRAAIARADSGAVGLGRIDSLLNYGVLNMTVLAPNDAAFQTLVFGLAYSGYLSTRPMPYTATDSAIALATANGAVAVGPAFLNTNNVSTALVKGIVAYHVLASNSTGSFAPNIRVFNANVPTTGTFFRTLVNGSVATHPGVRATATFSGLFASGLVFSGAGTFPPGGTAFSQPANAIKRDQNAVNGVYHIIDRVMLPQ